MRLKEVKDGLVKYATRGRSAQAELQTLFDYFQSYGPLAFSQEVNQEDGLIIVKSNNFRFGTIITSGKSKKELDGNIKDAILTAFDVPAVYLKESTLEKVGDTKDAHYALT